MVKERIPVMWARPCHSCGSPPSPSAAYSHSDGACLCVSCDARLQAANRAAALHQEHLWVCEACEKAPATVTCKADAASLCAACDANIHSANSLARRHHRVPILSISGVPHRGTIDINAGAGVKPDCNKVGHDDEDEAASWLLLNPGKNEASQSNQNGYNLYGREDEYLEGLEQNSTEDQYNKNGDFDQQMQFKNQFSNGEKGNGSDRVVPVQKEQIFQDDLEFERNKAGFSYSATTLGNSVSLASMEASIVPDNSMTDNSNSHSRPPKCTIDLFSGPSLEFPAQFAPMDREARVLRYREKRKTRKFEKTIRYASRKAYAETRPRIKGRFAKRTDVETEIDQMFCTTVMEETVYGIVPSFQVL